MEQSHENDTRIRMVLFGLVLHTVLWTGIAALCMFCSRHVPDITGVVYAVTLCATMLLYNKHLRAARRELAEARKATDHNYERFRQELLNTRALQLRVVKAVQTAVKN